MSAFLRHRYQADDSKQSRRAPVSCLPINNFKTAVVVVVVFDKMACSLRYKCYKSRTSYKAEQIFERLLDEPACSK